MNNDLKKTKRSLEERKLISQEYVKQFKTQYPSYFGKSFSLPPPKPAPALLGVRLEDKQMAQIQISDLKKSVLCGTVFGDASLKIQKNYKNARIQNRHSSRQSTWFLWKWLVCLKEFTSGEDAVQFQDPDGKQLKSKLKEGAFGEKEKLGKLLMITKADPKLTALHSILCPSGHKEIRRSWLNHMNSYFLMTLWLDDGSLYNGRQGMLCLDSTPLRQQEILRDYLKSVWGIETFCQIWQEASDSGSQPTYRLHFENQVELLKFLRIVAPIIPVKEMLYKILFVPSRSSSESNSTKTDVDLLQRWASEVSGLVLPEFRPFVEEYYKGILLNSEL